MFTGSIFQTWPFRLHTGAEFETWRNKIRDGGTEPKGGRTFQRLKDQFWKMHF